MKHAHDMITDNKSKEKERSFLERERNEKALRDAISFIK